MLKMFKNSVILFFVVVIVTLCGCENLWKIDEDSGETTSFTLELDLSNILGTEIRSPILMNTGGGDPVVGLPAMPNTVRVVLKNDANDDLLEVQEVAVSDPSNINVVFPKVKIGINVYAEVMILGTPTNNGVVRHGDDSFNPLFFYARSKSATIKASDNHLKTVLAAAFVGSSSASSGNGFTPHTYVKTIDEAIALLEQQDGFQDYSNIYVVENIDLESAHVHNNVVLKRWASTARIALPLSANNTGLILDGQDHLFENASPFVFAPNNAFLSNVIVKNGSVEVGGSNLIIEGRVFVNENSFVSCIASNGVLPIEVASDISSDSRIVIQLAEPLADCQTAHVLIQPGEGNFNSQNFIVRGPNGTVYPTYTEDRSLKYGTNTFYVSQNGSDTNNGLTPNTAFASVQKAVDSVLADPVDDMYITIDGRITTRGSSSAHDTNSMVHIDPNSAINLTIQSLTEDGAIIDATGLNKRVMKVAGTGLNLTLHNIMLTGGNFYNASSSSLSGGGGLLIHNANVTLKNVNISNNKVRVNPSTSSSYPGNGGGLLVETATTNYTLVMEDVIISDNSAASNGGGIMVEGNHCTVSMNNVVISGNSSGDGGGMFIEGVMGSNGISVKHTMTNVIIKDNTASSYGGGICAGLATANPHLNTNKADITFVSNVSITNNTAGSGSDAGGGGMYIKDGDLNLAGLVNISGNNLKDSTTPSNLKFPCSADESRINLFAGLDADSTIGLSPSTSATSAAVVDGIVPEGLQNEYIITDGDRQKFSLDVPGSYTLILDEPSNSIKRQVN